MTRCAWAGDDPLMVAYHDEEWGVPSHDDGHLFELLTLEGAQAGLSWMTILRKREGYRAAFAGFDPAVVAGFGASDVERLLGDAGIVRNRQKIDSTVNNAVRVLEVQKSFGSFAEYVWRAVDGTPVVGSWRSQGELPAETPASEALSRDLKGARLPLRGPDRLLLVHAGRRARERPYGRLLPLRRARPLRACLRRSVRVPGIARPAPAGRRSSGGVSAPSRPIGTRRLARHRTRPKRTVGSPPCASSSPAARSATRAG